MTVKVKYIIYTVTNYESSRNTTHLAPCRITTTGLFNPAQISETTGIGCLQTGKTLPTFQTERIYQKINQCTIEGYPEDDRTAVL